MLLWGALTGACAFLFQQVMGDFLLIATVTGL
jgi:hypothetical protein